jgi:hypothetical protein
VSLRFYKITPHALTRHIHKLMHVFQAEFEVLYPVMEKKLGEKGKQARQHSMQEHSKWVH